MAYLENAAPDAAPSDKDTLTFNMTLKCSRKPSPPPDSTNPDDLYINHELLSSHLVFTPVGAQVAVFAEKLPAATNPNIVLAKLRPGQEVDMILHAVKGVGKDHAKFSPVGSSSNLLVIRPRLTNVIQQRLPIGYCQTLSLKRKYRRNMPSNSKSALPPASSRWIHERRLSLSNIRICEKIP